MLKANRVSIVLAAAALIIVPALLAAPANAQRVERDRDWNGDSRPNAAEVGAPPERRNWNRDGRPNPREVGTPPERRNWNRDGRPNPREVGTPPERRNWNRDG
ncbi:hypothetical protein, partial [Nostoc sp.]|uniref:hypothetical protein n=1 Tax=Nostoc sp. TaxID=1180 RepID=UPI002FF71B1B